MLNTIKIKKWLQENRGIEIDQFLAFIPESVDYYKFSAGLLTYPSPVSLPIPQCGTVVCMTGVTDLYEQTGIHSSGYCCRFPRHSLFNRRERDSRYEPKIFANVGIK